MIIQRAREAERISSIKKWALVFGRRKTGKTFIVENFIKYDSYFFANRDMTILSKADGAQIAYDVFIDRLRTGLGEGKTVVVDEFHRLGKRFLDLLQSIGHGGKLILLTSTLFLAKELIGSKSPIMGLFNEVQIDLISLDDALNAIGKARLSKAGLVESAIMMQEPIAIEYFDGPGSVESKIKRLILGSVNAVPALFGEILTEEDRGTSAIYEGVVRAVANGRVTSGEISSSLFSKKLVGKDSPGFVQPYLDTMMRIGILKRIKVFNKNRFVYKLPSPLIRLFFYADEKYGISQRSISDAEVGRILNELMPHLVEDSVRWYLSQKYGLEEQVLEASDYDVDGVLVRFKKPEMVLEVKWGKRLKSAEIEKARTSMKAIGARKNMLFVRDKRGMAAGGLDVMDAGDLLG